MRAARESVGRQVFSSQRMTALLRTKRAIEQAIEKEMKQSAPCSLALQRLKREKLGLKDQLERLRMLQRARLAAG